VLADDPQLTVRRCAGRDPARVVIDPSGRMPLDARCMAAAGEARRIVIRQRPGPVPEGVEEVLLPGEREVSPGAIVAALFGRGLRRILVEGGANTISRFIDADCVDRLHVLVAPLIIGAGPTGLALRPEPVLARARRPSARVHLFADGDVLFDCDLREGRTDHGERPTDRERLLTAG